jgi:hypothetical protein
MIREEVASNPDLSNIPHGQAPLSSHREFSGLQERDSIHFQNDRMYRHHLARFNYTTYDVRRAQDVINPTTSHRDIMLLNTTDADSEHPFLYARVLGIYHVNTIYTGEDMLDYRPRRVDFLWVRWFEYGGKSIMWEDRNLDPVRFPPMASKGAFDFVNPMDVLRSCHILPSFRRGRVHFDGLSLSRCARDAQDWRGYFVNRYISLLIFLFFLLTCVLLDLLTATWLCGTIRALQ